MEKADEGVVLPLNVLAGDTTFQLHINLANLQKDRKWHTAK